MKQFLFLLLGIFIISSCVDTSRFPKSKVYKQEEVDKCCIVGEQGQVLDIYTARKIMLNGHEMWEICSKYHGVITVTHSPDCPCLKNKNTQEELYTTTSLW